MSIGGSSSVPDGAEPHAWINTDVTDHLRTLLSVFNTTGLYGHHRSFVHTEPPHATPLILKKDTQKMVFLQRFTYPAIPTVYPHLKRIALLPKLGIGFHSTVSCLSNPGRKAVKNNYFFLTCLNLRLSRVLSNSSKWKLRQIWKLRLGRDRMVIWQRSRCTGGDALTSGCSFSPLPSPGLPRHTTSSDPQQAWTADRIAQCQAFEWQRHVKFPFYCLIKFFRGNPFSFCRSLRQVGGRSVWSKGRVLGYVR